MINSVFLNFFSLHTALDDKGEAASETSLRLGPAGQSIWREVWQQPAAAGGRWKGTAPHWPQHGWQELQQEEHLQPTQVKQQTLTHSHHTRTWLSGPPLSHFLGMCGHLRRCNSASLQVRISGLWVRMKTEFKCLQHIISHESAEQKGAVLPKMKIHPLPTPSFLVQETFLEQHSFLLSPQEAGNWFWNVDNDWVFTSGWTAPSY